jgi:DNA-binding response OmpR family regulator
MYKKSKYAFFYCDECELLKSVIEIFHVLHPNVTVQTFSDVEKLISDTKIKVPELILVYLSKPDHDFITVVKYIRENVNGSSIPVVIYQELPEEKELRDLFKKIKM